MQNFKQVKPQVETPNMSTLDEGASDQGDLVKVEDSHEENTAPQEQQYSIGIAEPHISRRAFISDKSEPHVPKLTVQSMK
ncbi:putative phospholipid-transporting ATPase 9-like protein [Corchorus olitorius]|uniref:Phospholipid-transporting ATPase 9-like protein n=1 Tax=Corchorus olitorius TaxID=93759 RepID=A0A1R3FWX6_9ROSI|nr:putative phospholipid-transporting ATPase 9-like protein [Corchorus olitorius]